MKIFYQGSNFLSILLDTYKSYLSGHHDISVLHGAISAILNFISAIINYHLGRHRYRLASSCFFFFVVFLIFPRCCVVTQFKHLPIIIGQCVVPIFNNLDVHFSNRTT